MASRCSSTPGEQVQVHVQVQPHLVVSRQTTFALFFTGLALAGQASATVQVAPTLEVHVLEQVLEQEQEQVQVLEKVQYL